MSSGEQLTVYFTDKSDFSGTILIAESRLFVNGPAIFISIGIIWFQIPLSDSKFNNPFLVKI